VVKDQISWRNYETMGLAKSQFRQGLIKRVAKGQDKKNATLIPTMCTPVSGEGAHVMGLLFSSEHRVEMM
jgi:hypothetical protein